MKKNVVIALGGGLVIAILVAVLVQLSLGGKKKQEVVSVKQKTEILVAAKNIGIGGEIKKGDARWQEWPENAVFPGAIKRAEGVSADKALEGRVSRDVSAGEPLMKSVLLNNKGNLVAANLEPGMRAVGINVSASSMAGGFIGPGDFVDVMLTYKENIRTDDDNPKVKAMLEKNLDKLALETILQNIKVLAVDQMAKRSDDGKIKVGRTVTLAVDVQNAEKLILAQEMGDLTLTLRGVGDDQAVEKDWQTISDARLTQIDDELFSEYEKMQNDSGIQPNIVRIYRGEELVSVSVQ